MSALEPLPDSAAADWRDGFLFIGNHLSLDFVNTRPVVNGKPVELLSGGDALSRWLGAAALLLPSQAKQLERSWGKPSFGGALEEIRDFRETWRSVVFRLEAGYEPPRSFLAELNAMLLARPYVDQVTQTASGLIRGKRFSPQNAADALAPIAESVAVLLTSADRSRIRKCSGSACVLHFYDSSKKGTRRWCSMRMCGNRSKVAAYAHRKRVLDR